ncbi:MAG: hypothetical protein KME15_00550 [Drouetiella hepatica Uher 2000/2452]|jgi:hypothetical protein|uniref:Uncharacterized protein n=1 Tax=Drouetiella hepatica Uher 2000/2452 TaxID=904376 RepID=A0A951Q9C5_9CYAN|nr:hypothetical protein [Drouetiella hepatica Uher 2000/2452]
MSKEFETSFYAVEVENALELSTAQISIQPSDRSSIQEAPIPESPISQSSIPNPRCASSQRCLAHCWHTDQEWEQGQRCLVACWQNGYSQAEISLYQVPHIMSNDMSSEISN